MTSSMTQAQSCVHTLRSFEETLLASMIADTVDEQVDLRPASVNSPNFLVDDSRHEGDGRRERGLAEIS